MRIEPNIAQVGALFGEPSRAAILTVLLDGRAVPAGELAAGTGVGLTAASGHLAKLLEGRPLTMQKAGRHHYCRLAGLEIATVIEALAQLAPLPAIFRLPSSPGCARFAWRVPITIILPARFHRVLANLRTDDGQKRVKA